MRCDAPYADGIHRRDNQLREGSTSQQARLCLGELLVFLAEFKVAVGGDVLGCKPNVRPVRY